MGGWQWRKSFGRGPFRVSLSKKGVGYSVGIPGLRLGRSPTGKTYASQSIPGTGFRKITYLGQRKTSSSSGPVATPPTVGSPPSVPAPIASSGPALGALLLSPARGWFALARSTVRLSGRGLLFLADSLVSIFDWLNTRRRAGWTYTPPPVVLPPPPSAPVSAAPPPVISTPAVPAPAAAAPVPAAAASATPWWKQKLDP